MEGLLLTASEPFEKNVFFGGTATTPLFAITSKRTEDDVIDHVETYHPNEYDPPNISTKRSGDCVTRIFDFESGKQLFVLDALDTTSIREFLQTQDIDSLYRNPYASYKYVRDIKRTYKSGHKLVHKIDIINDVLVFRMYYFLPNFFEVGNVEGYHEITRICFKGDECWKENRNGNRYSFDSEYCYQKGTKEVLSERVESGKDVNELFRQLYPDVTPYCHSFRDFLYYFNTLYRGTRINKNVPKNIRDHLSRTYKKKILNRRDANPSVESAIGNGLVCYLYYDKEGTNMERIYFTKTTQYRFGYNKFKDCWVSTKRQKMNIMQEEVPYNGTTNTIMDYYGTMLPTNQKPTFAQVIMALESPLIEKLYKMGLANVVQVYASRSTETRIVRTTSVLQLIARSLGIDYNKKVMNAMEPYQLFGISRGQMKYISRDILNGGDVFSFRILLLNERVQNLFPDIKQRIEFAQIYLKRYRIDELESMDTEKLKYIGKIASSNHDSVERARLFTRWQDYLRIRHDAILYNDYLAHLTEQDGMPREIFKYEIYPKVSRIDFLHDKASRDATYYRQVQDKDRLALQDNHIKEFTSSPEYMQFMYENSDFTLVAPTCTEDLIFEGNFLSHCVATYASKVAKGESYIFFLRQKKDLSTPFYTMEVVKNNQSYTLRQCYTFHDTTDKTKVCRNFIEDWCDKNRIRIGCTL